jgi:hypothetical protein
LLHRRAWSCGPIARALPLTPRQGGKTIGGKVVNEGRLSPPRRSLWRHARHRVRPPRRARRALHGPRGNWHTILLGAVTRCTTDEHPVVIWTTFEASAFVTGPELDKRSGWSGHQRVPP